MTTCTNCHWAGDEDDLRIFNSVQHCPECKSSDCLIDYVSEYEEEEA